MAPWSATSAAARCMTCRVRRSAAGVRVTGLLLAVLVGAGCTVNAGAASRATTDSAVTGVSLVSIGAGLSGSAGLTGSAGLAASVFASGADHVSAFAFDADGRLWFATAAYTD